MGNDDWPRSGQILITPSDPDSSGETRGKENDTFPVFGQKKLKRELSFPPKTGKVQCMKMKYNA